MNDYYYFYDSSRPEDPNITAYFNYWMECLGDPKEFNLYTKEQILNLATKGNLSETKFKRILALKKGSNFKMSHFHSCGDLMLHRASEEEAELYDFLIEGNKKRKQLQKQIREATKELQLELSRLSKQLIIASNKTHKLRPAK